MSTIFKTKAEKEQAFSDATLKDGKWNLEWRFVSEDPSRWTPINSSSLEHLNDDMNKIVRFIEKKTITPRWLMVNNYFIKYVDDCNWVSRICAFVNGKILSVEASHNLDDPRLVFSLDCETWKTLKELEAEL